MDWMVWIWLIIAAVFFVGEMLTAGFFLLVFGIGAAGAALTAGLGGGQLWQWLVFVVLSAISFALSRRFAEKVNRGPTAYGVGAERYTGSRAMVTETVDNAAATGMVRIDREEWRADAVDDQVLQEGTWARVVRVDGTRLIVEAWPETEPSGEDA